MMQKLKENILKQLSNDVDKLFISIQDGESELSRINKEIFSSGQELILVNSEVSNLRKEKNDILKQIAQEQTNIKKERDDVLALKNESNQGILRANSVLKTIINQVETTKQIKIELDNEIRSIEPMKKVTISLEKTINNLTGDVKMVESEIKILTSQRESLDKEIKEKNKELTNVEKSIAEKKKELMPTIEQLNEREKKIKEREADLAIVEQRFKKLYGDKGAGFKV